MTQAEDSKKWLLEEAMQKPVQDLRQYDGFVGYQDSADFVMQPDNDGDVLTSGNRSDLRGNGSDLAVRMQVHADAKASDVLRVLDKLRDWLQDDLRDAGDMTVGEWRGRAGGHLGIVEMCVRSLPY